MVNYHTLEMKSGYTLLGWQPSSYQIMYLETSPKGACDHTSYLRIHLSTFWQIKKKKKKGDRAFDFQGPRSGILSAWPPSELWQGMKDWKQHIWDWAINSMKETEVEIPSICLLSRPLSRNCICLSRFGLSGCTPLEQSQYHHNWHISRDQQEQTARPQARGRD